MNDLAQKVAAVTGLTSEQVAKVLAALPHLAYSDGAEGFVLPGFGKFQVVPGAERHGRNPVTGNPVVLREPPEVKFTIDTHARKAFVSGGAKEPPKYGDKSAIKVLPPIRLHVDAEEALAAGVAFRKINESAFRVGGEPDWIQAPQVPICCGEPMLFYGQLDSLGGDYCLGDMGMLYVFRCCSCNSPSTVFQMY